MNLSLHLNRIVSLPPDDDGAVHLLLDDDSGEDAATDGHVAGERALLVHVVTLASLGEAKRALV